MAIQTVETGNYDRKECLFACKINKACGKVGECLKAGLSSLIVGCGVKGLKSHILFVCQSL